MRPNFFLSVMALTQAVPVEPGNGHEDTFESINDMTSNETLGLFPNVPTGLKNPIHPCTDCGGCRGLGWGCGWRRWERWGACGWKCSGPGWSGIWGSGPFWGSGWRSGWGGWGRPYVF